MPSFLADLLTPWLIGDAVFTLVLILLLSLSRPVYLAFRKRRAGFGVVFNSITGKPEPLAAVRLVTPGQYGQTVSTAITDKQGRYRLTAHPGEYLVDVKKEGFVFPSRYLKEKSLTYDNILPSARIIVKDHGVITKNIPIDPVDVAGKSQIFRGGIFFSKSIQYAIAYLSPFVLYLYPVIRHSWLAWGLFWAYVLLVLHRMFTYTPGQPAFGTVRDGVSHEPVEQAVVRIFSTKFNKLLETQITGPRGRYAFVVQPGAYYLLIKKPGYRSVRMNFPAIKKDGFVLAKDVTLQRAPIQYVDENPEPAGTPPPVMPASTVAEPTASVAAPALPPDPPWLH